MSASDTISSMLIGILQATQQTFFDQSTEQRTKATDWSILKVIADSLSLPLYLYDFETIVMSAKYMSLEMLVFKPLVNFGIVWSQ